MDFIIKNVTLNEIELKEFGIILPINKEFNLDYNKAIQSKEIHKLIKSKSIIKVNNQQEDLSVENIEINGKGYIKGNEILCKYNWINNNIILKWNKEKGYLDNSNIGIDPNGDILRSFTKNYETLLVDDNHIPNKKYVDILSKKGSDAYKWGNHNEMGYALKNESISISGGTIDGLITINQNLFNNNIKYTQNVVVKTDRNFKIEKSNKLILVFLIDKSIKLELPLSKDYGVGELIIKDANCSSFNFDIIISTINKDTIIDENINKTKYTINTNGDSIKLFSDGINKWFKI
jgi:hypothetical protein